MTKVSKKLSKTRALTSEDKKLAKRIRELREKRGLSQIELSLLVTTNTNYIAFIENDKRGLSLPMLYKIAKALKVKVSDLFTF